MGCGRFLFRDGTTGVLNGFDRNRSLSVSHALHPAFIDVSDHPRTLLVTSSRLTLGEISQRWVLRDSGDPLLTGLRQRAPILAFGCASENLHLPLRFASTDHTAPPVPTPC